MSRKEANIFYPSSPEKWRDWLEENHETEKSIWLLFYKVSSDKSSLTWSEAVDEALCFGWIDSTKKSIDHESYKQLFCQRKAKSTWSKVNKDKVEELSKAGKIQAAGWKCIEVAKENGSWNILDEVEALIVPKDLETEFAKFPEAKDFYLRLSKSYKKGILSWIVMAKRADTRQKRIQEIVECAGKGKLPKHFR
jgi:uncharacterized protein YdeI (YjbR/CyaY-like superfamily)